MSLAKLLFTFSDEENFLQLENLPRAPMVTVQFNKLQYSSNICRVPQKCNQASS